MNSGHYGGALIMERKIYALGGTETETNVVTNKSTMRYRPDVAALENKIYVTGGHCVGVAVSSVDFTTQTLHCSTWCRRLSWISFRDEVLPLLLGQT